MTGPYTCRAPQRPPTTATEPGRTPRGITPRLWPTPRRFQRSQKLLGCFQTGLGERPLIYPPTPFGPRGRVQLILTEKYFPINYLCALFFQPPLPPYKIFRAMRRRNGLGNVFGQQLRGSGALGPCPVDLFGDHSPYPSTGGGVPLQGKSR